MAELRLFGHYARSLSLWPGDWCTRPVSPTVLVCSCELPGRAGGWTRWSRSTGTGLGLPEVARFVDDAGHSGVILDVPSTNPYWDAVGVTVCDPDGFRVALVAARWTP